MFARRRTLWCKRMAVWQALLCLTVIAFLGRAIIPVGYMPEQGGGDHTFAMTLCMGGGGSTVMQVSMAGDDAATGDPAGELECPYGLCVGQKLLPDHPTLMLAGAAVFYTEAPAAARNQALPPLPALGPPLGSRAPPFNLG